MNDTLNTVAEQVALDRDRAADRALRAIADLRANLDAVAERIGSAVAGEPVVPTFVPNHQHLTEVVEYGARFAALWQTSGLIARMDHR